MDGQGLSQINILEIKRVDPYVKDIVDSSNLLHAVYMFDNENQKWKKMVMEKALFIYSRLAEPNYGVFINNMNAEAFVEPITAQTELKISAFFMLTRNEKKCT